MFRMLLVCHSYVEYPYVLVWCFSHDREQSSKKLASQAVSGGNHSDLKVKWIMERFELILGCYVYGLFFRCAG